MPITDYSTTAADNNAAPPVGAPEGMPAASVNNTMREMMANIKAGSGFSVDTIAGMQALLKAKLATGTSINVLGFTVIGDGGGGLFRWDSTSTATVDGGTIFAAGEGGTGRFLRIFAGALDVAWFGPALDGTDQTTEVKNAFIRNMIDRGTLNDEFTASAQALGFKFSAGTSEISFPSGYYTLNELHLITGARLSNQGNRYAGATFSFDPQLANKSLFNLHLTATSPPTGEGYPTVTQVATGGFSFDFLSASIAEDPDNNGATIFFGGNFVVDFNINGGWYNSLGGGSANETFEAGNPNIPFNTSLYRGAASGLHISPAVIVEGFCAVFDFTVGANFSIIEGTYDQCKYLIRSTVPVDSVVIKVSSGILGGPFTQQPSFLVHHDDTGQSAAILAPFTNDGYILDGCEISCTRLTDPLDPSTRLNSIRQGVLLVKTANGKNRHVVQNCTASVSGSSTGTSAGDPQTELQGAMIMDGPGRILSKNNNFILKGYNTVNLPPRFHFIKNMTDADAEYIIDGDVISAVEYDGISLLNKPFAIYIAASNTAGTIIIRDVTFKGSLQGCIFIEAGVTATIIIENPRCLTDEFLAGNQTLDDALYPVSSRNAQIRQGPEVPSFHTSLVSVPPKLTDNVATSVFRFTVQNTLDISGIFYVKYNANGNLGDYTVWGTKSIVIEKLLNAATTAAVKVAVTEQIHDPNGSANPVTVTFTMSAPSGAATGTQTIDLQVTLTDGGNGGFVDLQIDGHSRYFRPPNVNGDIFVEKV